MSSIERLRKHLNGSRHDDPALMPPPPPSFGVTSSSSSGSSKRARYLEKDDEKKKKETIINSIVTVKGESSKCIKVATTRVYLCLDRSGSMRERDVSSSSSSSSSGSSITRYDAIFQAATELVEQHAKNHGSTGIDFSLMLWSDDAEWIFRNCTAQKCLKRLVKAKASNKPCGGTNFSNPFRLLRQSIVASAEFVSTSVVIFLSDGRPGDLRSTPPLGGEMVVHNF